MRGWIYATVNMKEINLGTVKLSGEELLGFHLDVDTLKQKPNDDTHAVVAVLGSPLKGYVDSKDREQEQKDKYKLFYPFGENPLEEIWHGKRCTAYRTKAETDDMDVSGLHGQ